MEIIKGACISEKKEYLNLRKLPIIGFAPMAGSFLILLLQLQSVLESISYAFRDFVIPVGVRVKGNGIDQ